MKRLIVPPLPAASRPSNKITCRPPEALIQFCILSSSICSSRFSYSYTWTEIRSSYG